MKKKRIFVGYQLSKKLQQEIGNWQKKHSDLPVRWIPFENLHVTLVPPWYTENIDEVISLLHTNYPVSAVPIFFETISLGPENKRPWLMWARGKTPAEFLTLRMFLLQTLQRIDEKREPILHTTIARFSLEQFERFPDKQFSESIRWKERITSFSLIQSHLRRTGAVYETLTAVQL